MIKKLNGDLSLDAIVEIIKYNSGRVRSSWEIFHGLTSNYHEDEALINQVLNKLINGDPCEHGEEGEEPFKISNDSLFKIVILSKSLNRVDNDILKELLNRGLYELIEILGLHGLDQIQQLKPNDEQLFKLFQIYNPTELSRDEITDNVKLIKRLLLIASNPNTTLYSRDVDTLSRITKLNKSLPSNLEISFDQPSIPTKEEVFTSLESSLSQTIIKDAKYTNIRISLLKSYGLNFNEIPKVFQLYDDYQTIDRENFDTLQTTMLNIMSYQSIVQNNETFYKIANTFLSDPIPIKSLQSLILVNAKFNIDQSLTIFNDYIPKVSKKLNDDGVSHASSLAESLILSYLYRKDREFAWLIYDGAVSNGIIVGDVANVRVKKILKRYGEIMESETADEELEQLLLEGLREI